MINFGGLVLAALFLALAAFLLGYGYIDNIEVLAVVALPEEMAYLGAAIGFVADWLAVFNLASRLFLGAFSDRFFRVGLPALTRLRILFSELALLKVLS